VKDFVPAFAAIAEERPDAFLVLQDALAVQQRKDILDFAIRERLPSMFNEKEWALAGGLMSYGENFSAMYRRAGTANARSAHNFASGYFSNWERDGLGKNLDQGMIFNHCASAASADARRGSISAIRARNSTSVGCHFRSTSFSRAATFSFRSLP
jgi:hypothetical protein